MLRDAFLLQQLCELSDALQRQSAKGRTCTTGGADKAWSSEERQRILRVIGTRRAAGESFGGIAHALNQDGIRGGCGGRWYGATVRNFILRTRVEPN